MHESFLATSFVSKQPSASPRPGRSLRELSSTGEIMDLAAANAHLGIMDTRHDAQIAELIAEARQWCEQYIDRTFRTAVVRELSIDVWPDKHVDIYTPPLKTVDSIEYIDTTGAVVTLPTDQYVVLASTDNMHGRIGWASSFTCPTVAERLDAIKITYTSGYDSMPPVAVAAAKLSLTSLWDNNENPASLKHYVDRAEALLDGLQWGGYA